MNEEMVSTKRFFESHHITLSDYWLESCIQWYREENPNSNYTLETLHLKVYEQWLLLDLRDVEVSILPPNLTEQKKVVLNGIFALQILYVVDISRPKLLQIQKLRNSSSLADIVADNDYQPANSSKRMLQLRLTDGVQEIEAIEYKPIRELNVNLIPGAKIRITGPVIVRRGQMMLEEKHIKMLGGEVEELLVSNAAENVLARALNLPLTQNPNNIKEDPVSTNRDVLHNTRNQNQSNTVSTNSNVLRPPMQTSNNESINADRILPKQQKSVTVVPNIASWDGITDEDFDELLEVERDIAREGEHRKMHNPDVLVVEDDHPNPTLTSKTEEAESTTSPIRRMQSDTTKDIKQNSSFDDDKSIFEEMDIDAHLDLIDEQVAHVGKNSKQIFTIGELLKNRSNITSGKFTIRAKFKSLLQKLVASNEAWSLKLLITDGVDDLEIDVHTDLVSNLIGYCPSALLSLKRDVMNKDETATATVLNAMDRLKVKIMELDCPMEIIFLPNKVCPTLINLK